MNDLPDWLRQLQDTAQQAQKGLDQASRILAAQAAMGWAYRGMVDNVRGTLKSMDADQLRELSAASAMLASLADEEMASRR